MQQHWHTDAGELELLADTPAIERVTPEWRELWHSSSHRTSFNHPAFCLAWLSTIGRATNTAPRVLLVRRQGSLSLVAPLCRGPRRQLTAIGMDTLCDYHDWLVTDAGSLAAMSAVLRWLAHQRFECVLSRVTERQALKFACCQPSVSLSENSERRHIRSMGYSTMDKDTALSIGGVKFRQDTLRCQRRLRGKSTYCFDWYATPRDSVARAVAFIIRAKSAQYRRTGAEDYTEIPGFQEFLDELIIRTYAEGIGSVTSMMTPAGEMLAAHIGMTTTDALVWYLPAYDRKWRAFSPGRILILETMLEAKRRGLHHFDFTWGDDPYKLKWCDRAERLYTVVC